MARESCYYQDIFNYIVHGNSYPNATDSEKSELLKEAIHYTVIQGNLYRTYPSACKKLHLVLSKQINQKNAIFESHIFNDKHLSIKETCLNVRKKYHWKNMDNDIIEFIKQCPECNENNNSSFPVKAKLQQYEYLDRVWKLVEITVIGPLVYKESKVYLIQLADVFSKWMCFHKINDLDPKEISKILLKEFSIMGFPIGIRLVGLENSEEVISLFENEIKEFIEKTREVNEIFNSKIVPNSTEANFHQNEIDQSPKIESNNSNSPVPEELVNCPTEVNGGSDNIDDNSSSNNNNNNNNNNDDDDNNNNMDVTLPEKVEEESDMKTEEIKNTTELEVKEISEESLPELISTIPNGADADPVLEEKIIDSPPKNEMLFQRINETDDFLVNKLNDFETFIECQDENSKPFIYIFTGEKSIVDSETGNLYRDKLEKFINHFPDLWVEYLPNFILNVQSSASSSFQVPSQVMFHREPHLLGLFESSYLNSLIQFPDSNIESPIVENNIANGSHKSHKLPTSRKMKRYSLRQSPKPNESLGFFNDYVRTSPVKRMARSFDGNKRDFPPFKTRRLASKKDIIHALVEKYSLKDTFVVLQPLPSKVVESALAGNVKVANPVSSSERETPAEKSAEPNGLSLPGSSKETNPEVANEANKENNENHTSQQTQHEQEIAVR